MQIFDQLITHDGFFGGENGVAEYIIGVPDGYQYGGSYELTVEHGSAAVIMEPPYGTQGQLLFKVKWKYAFWQSKCVYRLHVSAEEIPVVTPPPKPSLPIVLEPPFPVIRGTDFDHGVLKSSSAFPSYWDLMRIKIVDPDGLDRIAVEAEIEIRNATFGGSVTFSGATVLSEIELNVGTPTVLDADDDDVCNDTIKIIDEEIRWSWLTTNIVVEPTFPDMITLSCVIDVSNPQPNTEYEIWIAPWSNIWYTNLLSLQNLGTSLEIAVKKITISTG